MRALKALIILSGLAALEVSAADFPFTLSRTPAGEYRLDVQGNSAVYFGLHHTEDLLAPFTTIKMALGTPGPIFLYTPLPSELRGFFRLEGIPNFAPADSDFDGMDDIWELENGLDPLNSADAFLPSARMPGKTNLEEYRLRFGLSSNKPQYYSREMSVFNYGAVVTQAVSREVGLFNFGAAWEAALSREVTVFNGDAPPTAGYPQVYSREVSLFNFGSPPFSTEALSRDVSVFNGDGPPIAGYPQIYSREVSVFNDGAPITSAISREVSVFNNIPQ